MQEITLGSNRRLEAVRAFAMDMDGTIYLGGSLLPGSREWKDHLDRLGIPMVFLTNNSSRSRSDYVDRLNAMGLQVTPDNILTSGEATIRFLERQHPRARVHLVGTPSLKREFLENGMDLAESDTDSDVVVLGFDTTLTYEVLRNLCDRVRQGLPFIATHPDFNCPTEDGTMPDVGSFLALVEASTGRRPDTVIGKPGEWMIEALSERLGMPPHEFAYVGDRLYTDVAMARASGMLAILTLTGETRMEDIQSSEFQPDLVVDNLQDLKAAYGDRRSTTND